MIKTNQIFFRNTAATYLELEHLLWQTRLIEILTKCKNPNQLAGVNFVPIKSAPDNNTDLSTIILLKNSVEVQGIGKPFCNEDWGEKQPKSENFSEKMRLVSTILVTAKPLILKLRNYQTGITLEYDLLYYVEAKTNDLLHLISVLIKNQPTFFNDPDTVILGIHKESDIEVRNLI